MAAPKQQQAAPQQKTKLVGLRDIDPMEKWRTDNDWRREMFWRIRTFHVEPGHGFWGSTPEHERERLIQMAYAEGDS